MKHSFEDDPGRDMWGLYGRRVGWGYSWGEITSQLIQNYPSSTHFQVDLDKSTTIDFNEFVKIMTLWIGEYYVRNRTFEEDKIALHRMNRTKSRF